MTSSTSTTALPAQDRPLSPSDAASHAALSELREQLVMAYRNAHPIVLQGGGTCGFYGNPFRLRGQGTAQPAGEWTVLDCNRYAGVVSYEPSELVVTARCGTPLVELEELLTAHGQCLPCDPPHFAPGRTVGGMVATGLSGPRRLHAGAVRDFILGTVLLSPDGSVMRFGGEVMKNVAGYDMSRLLCGSLGILGPIAEVSLKVLPLPRADITLRLEMIESDALAACNRWLGKPLPIAATCWYAGVLHVRLCGAHRAVEAAHRELGGELLQEQEAAIFWTAVRDHRHGFFSGYTEPLWRLSVPATTEPLPLPGEQLIEWGGALRWWRPPTWGHAHAGEYPDAEGHSRADTAGSSRHQAAHYWVSPHRVSPHQGHPHQGAPHPALHPDTWSDVWPDMQTGRVLSPMLAEAALALRAHIAAVGGSATLFCTGSAHIGIGRFHPLAPVNLQIHQRLKQAFDPRGLINPGRMYAEL